MKSFVLFLLSISILIGANVSILNESGGSDLYTQIANRDFKIDIRSDDDTTALLILQDSDGNFIGCRRESFDSGDNIVDINYSGDTQFIYAGKENFVSKSNKFYVFQTSLTCPVTQLVCEEETLTKLFALAALCNITESDDDFAIRPYRFVLEVNDTSKIKAGEDFNISIKALDYKGNVVQNYEENLSVRGDSPTIDYKEIKDGCKEGNLTITGDNNFTNEINTTLSYTEVGEINLSILEKTGSEFAKVDEDDTSESDRLIKADSVLVRVYPYDFNFSFSKDNRNFIYISNDLNMSGELDLNITAVNKKGEITENYNYKCYARDFNLTFTHNDINETILMFESRGVEVNVSGDANITFINLESDYFSTDNNGTAVFSFLLNLKKDYTTPVNPVTLILKEVNFTDKDAMSSEAELNLSYTFLYGRVKITDAVGYGRETGSKIWYLYWDNGWVENRLHIKEDGEVNLGASLLFGVDANISGNFPVRDINYTYSKTLPYGAVLHFDIPSWLWYNPLALSYKKPSNTNLNCRTHLCVKVTFIGATHGKGGIEGINPKYSDTNRTISVSPYKNDENVSKKEVKRILW